MNWGTESQKKPSEEELERFEELKKVPPPPLPPSPMEMRDYARVRMTRESVEYAKESRSRTYLVIAVALLFLVAAAVGAFFIWRSM